MTRMPGFSAEESLHPSRTTYRGTIAAIGQAGSIAAALVVRRPTTGCGCGLKECCCSVQIGGIIVYRCCPRDGSGPCYSGTLPILRTALVQA